MLRRLLAEVSTLVAILIVAAAHAQVPPAATIRSGPEIFGNLPLFSHPRLSPDGQYIAVLQPIQGRQSVVIFKTHHEPGAKTGVVTGGDALIEDIRWAKNNRLILVTRQNKQAAYTTRMESWRRAIAVDPDGQNAVALLKNMPMVGINTNASYVIDVNLDDPDHILMGLYTFQAKSDSQLKTHFEVKDNDFFRLDVVSVDVRTGKGEIFQPGLPNTNRWISDGHGHIVARINETKNPLEEHLFIRQGDMWQETAKFDASGDKGAGVVGLSEDGRALVQFSRVSSTTNATWGLVRRELKDGAISPLFSEQNYDASALVDEWTGQVIGAEYIDDKVVTRYFDPQRQALQAGLEKAFPGLSVSIESWTKSRDVVLFSVEGPKHPKVYHLLDRTNHQSLQVAATYPDLKETDLGEVKPYPYAARDGLSIPAYLTLPPGKEPKKLPVIVMPHGGPDARDLIEFDWWAQFLATSGYAVLQPNYRGSSGYGERFTRAGSQQWGLKMQDDVSDGVKKLIADGIADPKRICIVGGSYGGYSALAGAAFSPDLYACAVSWAGVADLPMEVHAEFVAHGNDSRPFSFWGTRMGTDDVQKLAETSPSRHAQNVKCPVLLMHGVGDTTVRIEQSEAMEQALMAAGKKVEFIRFEGEDHYLSVAATRIRMLKETERFLKQNIGN